MKSRIWNYLKINGNDHMVLEYNVTCEKITAHRVGNAFLNELSTLHRVL